MSKENNTDLRLPIPPKIGGEAKAPGLFLYDNLSGDQPETFFEKYYLGPPVKYRFAFLGLLVQGNAEFHFNLQSQRIEGNSVVFIPFGTILNKATQSRDVRHALIAFDTFEGLPYEAFTVQVSDDTMKTLLDSYHLLSRSVSLANSNHSEAIVRNCLELIKHIIDSAREEQRKTKPVQEATNHEQAVFNHFIGQVQSHYKTHRDVAFYASQACLSPRYFGKIILQAGGRKPSDWINEMDPKGEYEPLASSEAQTMDIKTGETDTVTIGMDLSDKLETGMTYYAEVVYYDNDYQDWNFYSSWLSYDNYPDYADVKFTTPETTGISSIRNDGQNNRIFYRLNGTKASENKNFLKPGIYIMKEGTKTIKVVVK